MTEDLIIVDRIEGETAICETEEGRVELPLSQLPEGTREGSCLRRTAGGYRPDPEEERRRRQRNHAAAARLFRRRASDGEAIK
ncbi:MAG: DUF3006 domain-containing protein [Clostridiales bacterium]|nr:DUF3006 domain-containing protein [Clostridiales bacterium]